MTLADIILAKIPPALLERVVFDQGVVGSQKRVELFKASGLSPQQIAERVVAEYGTQAVRLAYGLYEQVGASDYDTAKLLAEHLPRPDKFAPNNRQASLVGRIPTLSLPELGRFVNSVQGQICLIVSRNGAAASKLGTGFLIGPDLVLTCCHVLSGFPKECDIHADGRRVEIYFDFNEGNPVEDVNADPALARKAILHTDWHVESCTDTDPDGMLDDPLKSEDATRISKSLDFVLLRLNKPIGLYPVDPNGGCQRGWVSLPPGGLNPAKDDWIIIPQHPHGFPQRIDLGRFQMLDPTKTRLRYNTNTAPGTSGAPCFNQRFHLVGIHNATVGPPPHSLNQAIRFDQILEQIKLKVADSIQQAKGDSYMFRWSVSRPHEALRVILGRQKLLDWLRDSTSGTPSTLATRVYTAQAKKANAGCTYSVEILDAETRSGKAPRVVYGGKGQRLPATAEDFLISLLRELGIERAEWESGGNVMPPRPDARLDERSEADKLDRWLSDTLPDWLNAMITRHVERQFDRRQVARDAIEFYRNRRAEPPAEDVKLAAAQEPIIVRVHDAWDYAYVVIDELRATEYLGTAGRLDLKGEVYSLIAALVKGNPESLMGSGLKRLRWLFLGYLPDFIAADTGDGNGSTVEVLDPDKVCVDELRAVIHRISKAHLGNDLRMALVMARYFAEEPGDPTKARLVQLQDKMNGLARILLEVTGDAGTQQ